MTDEELIDMIEAQLQATIDKADADIQGGNSNAESYGCVADPDQRNITAGSEQVV